VARWTCYVVCSLLVLGCSEPPAPAAANAGTEVLVEPGAGQPNILVFSRTGGFRHDSIPAGLDAITGLAQQHGFGLAATEDKQQLTDQNLARFSAVVFLNTTGEILDAPQEAAFERYIGAGHGFVGVHAASDCEYQWPFYGGLVGAYFAGHSLVAEAVVKVEPVAHAGLANLPLSWTRTDEWYGFGTNPRSQVTVLLTVDEASYDPGQGLMGADHPVAWYHAYQGGRAFYTALGHTAESFRDPLFLGHLLGGIEWAAGAAQ
jgi:type 1 glutamine amidotransferase